MQCFVMPDAVYAYTMGALRGEAPAVGVAAYGNAIAAQGASAPVVLTKVYPVKKAALLV